MSKTHKKTPEELLAEFYALEGQCISEWAATDEVLFFLCLRVLRCTTEHAAIVYYRTPTLDSRLSLASDLVGSVIPKPIRPGEHPHPDWARWKKIAKEFRELLSVRNRIAHEPIGPTFRLEQNEELKGEEISVSGFELYASYHERSSGRPEKPPLRIAELRAHLEKTANMAKCLKSFTSEVLELHSLEFASQFPLPSLRSSDPRKTLP